MLHGLSIRPAAAADAESITAIYNEGIADRVATFETTLRSPADVDVDELPFLVATEGDLVVGFARVGSYSDRCVHHGVGGHGVYVARSARGRGIGRNLLVALADASETAGHHKLSGRIFSDIAASRAAHLAAGFHEAGLQRRHGKLDNQWKDCVLVERMLGDAADAPA